MFVGEAFLAKVSPHKISNVEYHGLFVDVGLGRESLYLALDGVPCIFMHFLEVVDSGTRVHVGALLKRKRKNVQRGQWVETLDDLERGLAGS